MKLKIFRYKVTILDTIHIVSVGILPDKEGETVTKHVVKYMENNGIITVNADKDEEIVHASIRWEPVEVPTVSYNTGWGGSTGGTVQGTYQPNKRYKIEYDITYNSKPNIVDYSFAYSITAPMDKLNLNIEHKILSGRVKDTKYCKHDFKVPIEFHSYGAIKAFAFSYCRTIMDEWCAKRYIKDKFKIEDYKV